MNKLQTAVGESKMSKGDKSMSMEDAEAMYSDELEGIRENMTNQVRNIIEVALLEKFQLRRGPPSRLAQLRPKRNGNFYSSRNLSYLRFFN